MVHDARQPADRDPGDGRLVVRERRLHPLDPGDHENPSTPPTTPIPAIPHHAIPDGGGVSYFNIGPGLRQSVCNRLDFGGAITWATDTAHWAQPWFRFEVRFLF